MSLLIVTTETSGLDGSNPQTWFPLIKEEVWTSNNGTDPSLGYFRFMLFLDQRTRGFGVFTYDTLLAGRAMSCKAEVS